MPLNGRKWPQNGRGRQAARCSSKSEWIVSNTHIVTTEGQKSWEATKHLIMGESTDILNVSPKKNGM